MFSNPGDLSPFFHPAMSRALVSFEPVWLGGPRGVEFGVGGRREIAEPTVWPDRVVVILKAREHLPRMGDRREQRLVEQLIAKASVEALDEGVLLRLTGRDVMPLDPGLL